MALWNRVSQSRSKLVSNYLKTYHFQVPSVSSLDYIPKTSKLCLVHNPCGMHKRPEFCLNVRFLASLKQANNVDGQRLNDQIEARFIRLVTDEGHRVISTREALEQAWSLKLDLVEVDRNGDPPVCKIMDFHKEKYKQKVKEKDRAKSKSEVTLKKAECKIIRFSDKTEHKDLKMKADMVKKLMERGYRVKCVALGQKKKHKPFPKKVSVDDKSTEDLGDDEETLERIEAEEFAQELRGVLSQLTTLIEDVAVVESGPRVEKRQAYVIVKHVKFGPSKKGGGKKSKDVQATQATPKPSGSVDEDAVGSLDEDLVEFGDESEDQLSADENDFPDEYHYPGRTPLYAGSKNGTKAASINFVKNNAELQSDHRNLNCSNLSYMRPVHDSTQADRVLPSTQKPSDELNNRYSRVEPRPRFSQISKDSRPSDRRDSFRFDQQFSNEIRQLQPETNVSEERSNTGSYSSGRRNTNVYHNEVHRLDSEHPSPSYGIFSSQNMGTPPREGTGASPNTSRSQVDSGQRKWGIFSRDNASKTN